MLKHYRDKAIAHLAERDPDMGVPLLNDLLAFASGTSDVWARLARGVGLEQWNVRAQVKPYEESAKAFWRLWFHPPSSGGTYHR
jgi:hypothetical protein